MKEPKRTCAICHEPRGRFKTFCDACTSWWYRIQLMTPEHLAKYLRRHSRTSKRILHWRNHSSRGKKAA